MPQKSYSVFQPKGFEGSLYREEGGLSVTGTTGEFVNGQTTRLPYGRVVVAGTLPGEVVLPSADGQTPIGITVQQNAYEKAEDGTDGVPPDRPVAVLKRGAVLMVAETAISTTDDPHFRFAAQATPGAHDAIGRVRPDVNAIGSAEHADKIDNNSKFLAAANAGELVPVWVDFGG